VPSPLATLNAVLNALATCALLLGWRFVRRGQWARHRACMLTAFGLSIAFLVSYTIHHARVGSVPFRGHGALKAIYLAILAPHVLLAALVVPLSLVTLVRALGARYDKHKKIARWTLPIWLYVSVSGVVVYWMLYHL
jgi:uncharacterized membrane protein YozB (DUF420 family)